MLDKLNIMNFPKRHRYLSLTQGNCDSFQAGGTSFPKIHDSYFSAQCSKHGVCLTKGLSSPLLLPTLHLSRLFNEPFAMNS